MKYRNNLSNVSESSIFKVVEPFKVFVPVGQYDSNSYFGSSQLIGVMYRHITLQPGDYLYDTPGGVFVTYNGKHYPAKIYLSDKHPFEKTYGLNEETYPLANLQKIDSQVIKLDIVRDYPKINHPRKCYGRSIDSVE